MEAFLKEHADELTELDNGKIRCLITSHDIKKKLEILEAHWNGKAFRKAQRQQRLEANPVDLEKYEGYIIEHKSNSAKVYCKLTKRILNKDSEELDKHILGRKYKYYMNVAKRVAIEEKLDKMAEEEEAGFNFVPNTIPFNADGTENEPTDHTAMAEAEAEAQAQAEEEGEDDDVNMSVGNDEKEHGKGKKANGKGKKNGKKNKSTSETSEGKSRKNLGKNKNKKNKKKRKGMDSSASTSNAFINAQSNKKSK